VVDFIPNMANMRAIISGCNGEKKKFLNRSMETKDIAKIKVTHLVDTGYSASFD